MRKCQRKVDFSIGLASVIPEQAGSTEETNRDEEFEEAQDSHTLAPRRANPFDNRPASSERPIKLIVAGNLCPSTLNVFQGR